MPAVGGSGDLNGRKMSSMIRETIRTAEPPAPPTRSGAAAPAGAPSRFTGSVSLVRLLPSPQPPPPPPPPPLCNGFRGRCSACVPDRIVVAVAGSALSTLLARSLSTESGSAERRGPVRSQSLATCARARVLHGVGHWQAVLKLKQIDESSSLRQ